MVVFEVPTGVVADTLGRRVSFLLSVAVLAATTLLYVGLAEVGAGVVAFSVVSVAMGLGFTFYSGAMEAWLVDALAVTGYHGRARRGLRARPADHRRGDARGHGRRRAARPGRPVARRTSSARRCSSPCSRVAYVVMHDLGFTPRRVTAGELPGEVARNARAGVAVRLGAAAAPAADARVARPDRASSRGASTPSQPYLLDLLESDAVWVAGLVAAGIALSTIAGNQLVERALAPLRGGGRRCCSAPRPSRRARPSRWGSSPRSGLALPARSCS